MCSKWNVSVCAVWICVELLSMLNPIYQLSKSHYKIIIATCIITITLHNTNCVKIMK